MYTLGIKGIWHNVKLRGRGYAKADSIMKNAKNCIGIKVKRNQPQKTEIRAIPSDKVSL